MASALLNLSSSQSRGRKGEEEKKEEGKRKKKKERKKERKKEGVDRKKCTCVCVFVCEASTHLIKRCGGQRNEENRRRKRKTSFSVTRVSVGERERGVYEICNEGMRMHMLGKV